MTVIQARGDEAWIGVGWGWVNVEEPARSCFAVTAQPGRTLDFLKLKTHGFETFMKDF